MHSTFRRFKGNNPSNIVAKLNKHGERCMKCEVFEDNNDALELVKAPKMRRRTKHIANKRHHFRSFVESCIAVTERTDTGNQEVDFLTKLLVTQLFSYLRKKVIGW